MSAEMYPTPETYSVWLQPIRGTRIRVAELTMEQWREVYDLLHEKFETHRIKGDDTWVAR